MKKILRNGREVLFEKNIERFVFGSIFLFLISVVVYSAAPNPGHLTTEIDGSGADANLQVTLDGLQQDVISCAAGKAITKVNIDGTVVCDDVTAVWGAPSSIIARDGANTGNMGGYAGMAAYCNSDEHVCSANELIAWEQNGGANRIGWYNTGIRTDDGNNAYGDCNGWHSASTSWLGNYWANYYSERALCNANHNVLCCKY